MRSRAQELSIMRGRIGHGWESKPPPPTSRWKRSRLVGCLVRCCPFPLWRSGPGLAHYAYLPGWGIALDQSEVALRVLRSGHPDTPVVRGDTLRLPVRDRAVVRVFAAHIYGLLTEDQRGQFLSEARRVADEIVVVDAGRPLGVPSEHWQRRSLGGETFMVFRRHFDSEALAAEVDGRPLFSGRFYVVVSA